MTDPGLWPTISWMPRIIAGSDKTPGADVSHKRGQRCDDASVETKQQDACIREAASARAALTPRSPRTICERASNGTTHARFSLAMRELAACQLGQKQLVGQASWAPEWTRELVRQAV
jgi:hypothetical protein